MTESIIPVNTGHYEWMKIQYISKDEMQFGNIQLANSLEIRLNTILKNGCVFDICIVVLFLMYVYI